MVRVTDGDTIVVLDSTNAQHKIRLTGIDAPACCIITGSQGDTGFQAAVQAQPDKAGWL